MNRFARVVRYAILLLPVFLAGGCAPGFVGEAARTSLASFITSVLSTAVNQTVNPQ